MPLPRVPPLALLLVAALAPGCSPKAPRPNILLITLDTTRRDHLGMYGYAVPTSPRLDELARDSVVYTRAYAVSSWTMPTHASMFTGKFPSAHGANYDPDGPLNLGDAIGGAPGFDRYRARPIAEDETTLAQVLQDDGYATGGVIAGPWLIGAFRLGKGFQEYDDQGVTELNGRPAAEVTDSAIAFVDRHPDEPFFLFCNYYDPHNPTFYGEIKRDANGNIGLPPPIQPFAPLLPPGASPVPPDVLSYLKLCYDAEVRYMDEHIGRLLDHLRERGLYENTWIIVLSDHGDLIGDPILSGEDTPLFGHGDSLTEPEIHIPFLVKDPGAEHRRGEDATPVQQVDVLPTILARLGITLPANVQGTPLDGKHPIVAELYKLPMMNREGKDWRHLGDWRVMVHDHDKFGWSSNGTNFLVDLAADPGERRNLVKERADLAAKLEAALTAYVQHLPRPGAVGEVAPLSEEQQQLLKGLGYVGDENEASSEVAPVEPQKPH